MPKIKKTNTNSARRFKGFDRVRVSPLSQSSVGRHESFPHHQNSFRTQFLLIYIIININNTICFYYVRYIILYIRCFFFHYRRRRFETFWENRRVFIFVYNDDGGRVFIFYFHFFYFFFFNSIYRLYRLYWIDWQTTIDDDDEQGDIQPRVCPWLGFSFARFKKRRDYTSHTRIHTYSLTHARTHTNTHTLTRQKKTMASHSHVVKLCADDVIIYIRFSSSVRSNNTRKIVLRHQPLTTKAFENNSFYYYYRQNLPLATWAIEIQGRLSFTSSTYLLKILGK